LAVDKVTAMECSDEDDIVWGASARSATFAWEDMTKGTVCWELWVTKWSMKWNQMC
jgi:hypothetical protein